MVVFFIVFITLVKNGSLDASTGVGVMSGTSSSSLSRSYNVLHWFKVSFMFLVIAILLGLHDLLCLRCSLHSLLMLAMLMSICTSCEGVVAIVVILFLLEMLVFEASKFSSAFLVLSAE